MRTTFVKTIAPAVFALALAGAAMLRPSPAAADAAKCPCTPPAQPNFPTIEREGPAAVALEGWVMMWLIMHNW